MRVQNYFAVNYVKNMISSQLSNIILQKFECYLLESSNCGRTTLPDPSSVKKISEATKYLKQVEKSAIYSQKNATKCYNVVTEKCYSQTKKGQVILCMPY